MLPIMTQNTKSPLTVDSLVKNQQISRILFGNVKNESSSNKMHEPIVFHKDQMKFSHLKVKKQLETLSSI